ncbi:MAG: lipid-A-disaccharide synthase [Synergistales bacterium]|nr:lipid-A-disaccharide synthase [Synergistales bacterium]HOC82078.1 lipid-A-disaccharide synthase [Synergistales bacterium]
MGDRGDRRGPGSLFVSCGEASGDQYSKILIEALRSAGFQGVIWGMLGPMGASAGGEAAWDSGALSLMGVSEVLGAVPRLARLKREICDVVLKHSPAGVVVIDSPDFHLPLLKALKKKGYRGKVFYIAPPAVWAWRPGRVSLLAELCDLCFPLFDFERVFLEGHGVPCRWFGHPLSGILRDMAPAEVGSPKEKTVALLPGSRKSEVSNLLPVLLETAEGLAERGYRPIFSVAPGLRVETATMIRDRCQGWDVYDGPGAALMASSGLVIGSSGTAAVEALILDRYMIVLYRASFSSWLVYKAFVRTRWVSIPNILAGGDLYPELLQFEATPGRVLRHFDDYVGDPTLRRKIDGMMRTAARSLGGDDAPWGWADSILEVLPS